MVCTPLSKTVPRMWGSALTPPHPTGNLGSVCMCVCGEGHCPSLSLQTWTVPTLSELGLYTLTSL